MKTEILLSALFFIIGAVLGASTVGYFVWKHIYSDDVEEELEELEEMQFPLKNMQKLNESDIKELLKNAIPINPKQVFEGITNAEFFKNKIEQSLHITVTNTDNWEKATYLRDLLSQVDEWYEPRKKWFLDRIGKRVKPSEAECPCEGCKNAVEDGIVIQDENIALSLFAQENRSKANQGKLRYSDYES